MSPPQNHHSAWLEEMPLTRTLSKSRSSDLHSTLVLNDSSSFNHSFVTLRQPIFKGVIHHKLHKPSPFLLLSLQKPSMSKWSSWRRTKGVSESVNHHREALGLVKITRNPFGGKRMIIRNPQINMGPKNKQGGPIEVFFAIGRWGMTTVVYQQTLFQIQENNWIPGSLSVQKGN